MNTKNTSNLSAIDKALAAAKARKAAKDTAGISATAETKAPKVARAKATTDADAKTARKLEREATKAQKAAQLTAEREARRAEREKLKAEKAAAKATANKDRKPAHMKKVEKAAARLPALNTEAQLAYSDITSNFSRDQIAALALHLQHHNRVVATQVSADVKLQPGDSVRIIGGEPRFIGTVGTIERARRIRCFVNVPGRTAPVYLFTSEVELVKAPAAKVAATA